jgi:hypothetical protein
VDRLENWVYRHPRRILLGFGLLSAASMALALMIPRDTFLLEDVGQNDPIRGSMEFFEKESFGVRPFEAGVTVKEGYRLTDVQVLKLLEGLEKELDQSADFSPFLSPRFADYGSKLHLRFPARICQENTRYPGGSGRTGKCHGACRRCGKRP